MEASRYIRNVTSDSLLISDMGKYLGKQVEIIVFPREPLSEQEDTRHEQLVNVRGRLHKYANLARIDEENTAWQKAAQEKHAIR